jgi:inositol oxygenase
MEETTNATPLENLDDWDEFLVQRYPEKADEGHTFRDYEADARPSVREFYRLNHTYQTLDFVRAKKADFLARNRRSMGIWEAMEFLNTLIDDSDPDGDFTQIQHLMMTAEAIRKDGHPRWFIVTGLIHDLGKILCLFGEPQWAVVGDTFPVGCRYSETIVFPQYFAENPDSKDPALQTENGIYAPHCGLDKVHLSWGHDEYLYHVVKDYLPDEALAMIRYHSFYPWHKEEAYGNLTNARDEKMLRWVRAFNPYDLYTKTDTLPDVEALTPYYQELIAEFFPAELRW